ncbi:uncharacterized protein LOC118198833 [Stegodyphus dumicola]|uniref:uncharacterized protein LOC118198833 n=1 Tax=Stegodyphus dumicola TaxID=202533 RepID=UPI0015B1072D|nr:uncharacterized protein LOC118198833 [Stegodyphus dumicola]
MDASKRCQHAVVQFFTSENVSSEIYHRIQSMKCMKHRSVFRWCSDFHSGKSSDDRPRPGQVHVVITQEAVANVDRLMKMNWLISTLEIVEEMSMSIGSVHTINTARKVAIPQGLCAIGAKTFDRGAEKIHCMSVSMQHLSMRYHEMGNQFLSRIIVINETWCHHFNTATESMSMEW